MMKWLPRVLPSISLVFTAFMPAALQLTFAVTAVLSLGQSHLLRNASFRRFAGIQPLPPKRPKPGSTDSSLRSKINVYEPPSTSQAPKTKPDSVWGKLMGRARGAAEKDKRTSPRLSKSVYDKAQAYDKERREVLKGGKNR